MSELSYAGKSTLTFVLGHDVLHLVLGHHGHLNPDFIAVIKNLIKFSVNKWANNMGNTYDIIT